MSSRVMPKTDRLPNALYRAAQVRELDRLAIEQFAIPGAELMQRAGASAFALARERWPQAKSIVVLVGTGNNGGDGFVFALMAHQAGLRVSVMQVGDRDAISGDARHYADRWKQGGGSWEVFGQLPPTCDLIVDAMLGTGLQRDVRGAFLAAIEAANAHRAPVLAIDLPSGLHADTGSVFGAAIKADATLSFIGLKQGMFTAEGADRCGEVFFDALEVPAKVYASQILSARRIDWEKQQAGLAPRSRTVHKGHFGHVLVVGGDHGFGGAAHLAAEAALRCGAGLVSVATRERHVAGMLAARPELMVHAVDHTCALEPLLQRATVVVLGPGLGTSAWGRALFELAISVNRPMVVDADGLNQLAEQGGERATRRDDWILTPHPGEAGRLLSVCNADIHGDRFAAALALQRRFGGVAVLKGAGTIVQSEKMPPAVCTDGNPGMASGGMGDVLSGVIAGLLAQGWALSESAETGVCLHAAAADRAAMQHGERGLLAGDLMNHLRILVNGS